MVKVVSGVEGFESIIQNYLGIDCGIKVFGSKGFKWNVFLGLDVVCVLIVYENKFKDMIFVFCDGNWIFKVVGFVYKSCKFKFDIQFFISIENWLFWVCCWVKQDLFLWMVNVGV